MDRWGLAKIKKMGLKEIGINLDWQRNERDRCKYKRDRLRLGEEDWKRYM